MTRNDLRMLSTALAFTGLMLRSEKVENQSDRIKDFAKLIEAFCFETTLEALSIADNTEHDQVSVDLVIDCFKAEMRDKEPITPPADRVSLLKIHDRLHHRQQRRKEKHLHATGSDEEITNRVLRLIREEIKADEAEK